MKRCDGKRSHLKPLPFGNRHRRYWHEIVERVEGGWHVHTYAHRGMDDLAFDCCVVERIPLSEEARFAERRGR